MTDYSEALILARKALASAEAYALHGDWAGARDEARRVVHLADDLFIALDWQRVLAGAYEVTGDESDDLDHFAGLPEAEWT